MTDNLIYVKLLDEGIEVWRPIAAVRTGENTFRITEVEQEGSGESWEFHNGQNVLVEQRVLGGEAVLVAVVESPTFR
jgi:hypothetical protein